MAEQEYREFLTELGACPECMSIPEHHIDEPFATCGCWTSEDYAESPLMQAQLMRTALKEMQTLIKEIDIEYAEGEISFSTLEKMQGVLGENYDA